MGKKLANTSSSPGMPRTQRAESAKRHFIRDNMNDTSDMCDISDMGDMI